MRQERIPRPLVSLAALRFREVAGEAERNGPSSILLGDVRDERRENAVEAPRRRNGAQDPAPLADEMDPEGLEHAEDGHGKAYQCNCRRPARIGESRQFHGRGAFYRTAIEHATPTCGRPRPRPDSFPDA